MLFSGNCRQVPATSPTGPSPPPLPLLRGERGGCARGRDRRACLPGLLARLH